MLKSELIEGLEELFKKNFPEYVTEKGVCLSPYWDLFSAGIEAGRPKWHDLRKNPEDLPKINQKVLLQIKDEGRPIMDFYTRYGVWNFTNEYEAIAWCEIPKFEEKNNERGRNEAMA